MSWSTFIKAHGGAIAATDLFTVEVVNPFGLVRYHVLFVIDIVTRCVVEVGLDDLLDLVLNRRCCTALAESEIRLWWWPRYVRA